ncbi:hypothetical protein L210DRAFT_2058427 [Boletus edulis BED1]|uniref:Uncharacterized protein n=1 Tax=Boletus edulis BED1 TaxID=1328754 RepID=A0AAD4GMH3_BOLED|nr:hypothetical protein L210DRAFT_2058427 [Boletus edulis BED1]
MYLSCVGTATWYSLLQVTTLALDVYICGKCTSSCLMNINWRDAEHKVKSAMIVKEWQDSKSTVEMESKEDVLHANQTTSNTFALISLRFPGWVWVLGRIISCSAVTLSWPFDSSKIALNGRLSRTVMCIGVHPG